MNVDSSVLDRKLPMITPAQATFFGVYAASTILWAAAEFFKKPEVQANAQVSDEEARLLSPVKDAEPSTPPVSPKTTSWLSTGLFRCLILDRKELQLRRELLKGMAEFGTIMLFFYLCDRSQTFGTAEKTYSRDLFIFLFLLLTIVAFITSRQSIKAPVLLNRPQTEEWKGWMQILFLLYHYFEAREAYNAVRIFIAGYVWMTGFGNFSYYYKTGDYCFGRFCQMMWRLNFLVLCCCAVLNNSYMLYYICPMHTVFTVLVYAALGIANHLNKHEKWIWIKFGLSVVSVVILWDIKAVFYLVWGPFRGAMGYLNPRKPEVKDDMHEWYFRSSLDRYVWIWGMVCAFVHPRATAFLSRVDALPTLKRASAQLGILVACIAVMVPYYQYVYALPKLQYNEVHPYTSWIPLTIWAVLRNLTGTLRGQNLRLYGWLGCITLETYISQFHIWLHTGIPNGQPGMLLVFIPGYPLVNFMLCSALYIYISHRLFLLTNLFKSAFIPHDDNATLIRNLFIMAGTLTLGYILACVLLDITIITG